MTRLATNGFEAGVLATDGWTGGGTLGAYDSVIFNSGAKAYKFASGSVPGTDLITRPVAAVLDRQYWFRTYWRAASAAPTGTHMIMEIATNAGGFWSEIDFNAVAGKLSWQRTGGPGNQDLGVSVVAGQWYCIDYGVRHNTAGTATFDVWVDDVLRGSFSAASGFGTVFQKVVLGNDASANYTTDAWWDDFAVNDDQGASDNGRIGPIIAGGIPTLPVPLQLRRFQPIPWSPASLSAPAWTWPTVAPLPPTQVAIGLITETDDLFAFGRLKQKAIGLGAETDLAQAMGRQKLKSLALTNETDTAQAQTRLKQRALSLLTESDSLFAFVRVKQKALGLVTETDTALPIPRGGTVISVNLGLVTETDSPLALTRQKRKSLALLSETDSPFAFARLKQRALSLGIETDLPQATVRQKRRAMGLASEGDTTFAFLRLKQRALSLQAETDTAQHITAFTGTRSIPMGLIQEKDTAMPFDAIIRPVSAAQMASWRARYHLTRAPYSSIIRRRAR